MYTQLPECLVNVDKLSFIKSEEPENLDIDKSVDPKQSYAANVFFFSVFDFSSAIF